MSLCCRQFCFHSPQLKISPTLDHVLLAVGISALVQLLPTFVKTNPLASNIILRCTANVTGYSEPVLVAGNCQDNVRTGNSMGIDLNGL